MPMPGLPMPGGSFTAPPGGRMLDPTPRREQSRDRDRDTDLTTPDDLDLTLFPDGAAVAGGVVAGGAVGSSVTGVTTPANVTGTQGRRIRRQLRLRTAHITGNVLPQVETTLVVSR
jgi:hypothetical protein